jgi:hypothetical protein
LTENIAPNEILERLNGMYALSGLTFLSATLLPREGIKKREKLIRNIDPIPYEILFETEENASEVAARLPASSMPKQSGKTVYFMHSQKEFGGVLKMFTEKDIFHLKRLKYYFND